jgi:hypothetical protein
MTDWSFLSKWLAILNKKNHFLSKFEITTNKQYIMHWTLQKFKSIFNEISFFLSKLEILQSYFAEKEPLFVKNPRKHDDRDRIKRVLHHDNASSSPFDLGHRKHTAKACNTIGLRLTNDRLVFFDWACLLIVLLLVINDVILVRHF